MSASTDSRGGLLKPLRLVLPPSYASLERALVSAHERPDGQAVLKGVFRADRFEPAPKNGYRALSMALRPGR